MFYFAGEEFCCQDTFPNIRNAWAKAFKENVGRLSLELCISYIRSCFLHGNMKLLYLYFRATFSTSGCILKFGYMPSRLLLHQKTNGKGKNLELEEEKRFTCSYIIGI